MIAKVCPRCGSKEIVKIVYGLPSQETIESQRKGEIAIGGDIAPEKDGDFSRYCKKCKREFNARTGKEVVWGE